MKTPPGSTVGLLRLSTSRNSGWAGLPSTFTWETRRLTNRSVSTINSIRPAECHRPCSDRLLSVARTTLRPNAPQKARRRAPLRPRYRKQKRGISDLSGGAKLDDQSGPNQVDERSQIADELRNVYVIGYYPTKSLSEGG